MLNGMDYPATNLFSQILTHTLNIGGLTHVTMYF